MGLANDVISIWRISFWFPCLQIEKVSGPIILNWVIGQHTHILEWTGRALDFEVRSILIG